MAEQTNSHPIEAFWFRAEPVATFQTPSTEKPFPRKFTGVAYSGAPINHGYWSDQIVFDIATTTAADKIPVLIEHNRDQRAGFATLAFTDKIEIADGSLIDNPHGRSVAMDADAGFPWQLSVHITPSSIEEVNSGAQTVVNGRTVSGPVKIFRNSTIREVSFTPTGVDNLTKAAVMSVTAASQNNEEKTAMDKPEKSKGADDLQKEVDRLTAEVEKLKEELKAEKAKGEEASAKAKDADEKLKKKVKYERKMALSQVLPEITEAEIDVYFSMPDETFDPIMANLKKAADRKLPDHLFSAQAVQGTANSGAPDGKNEYLENYKQVYGGRA